MNKFYCLFILVQLSCGSFKKVEKINFNMDLHSELKQLFEYPSSCDSLEMVKYYPDLGLKEFRRGDTIEITLRNEIVFVGVYQKYDLMFEIWNNSYLLITINDGKFGFYGPEGVPRGNVLILDLNNALFMQVSMTNTFLTRSTERLKGIPVQYNYYIIHHIDIEANKIVLINVKSEYLEFTATRIKLAFKCL
jgi:hypothetical protein